MRSKRPKFEQRKIYLRTEVQRNTAIALLSNVPLDDDKPLELIIREEVKVRGLDANGYYWLRLNEISEQAWFNGRKYNADIWHEYMKREVMPEEVTTKDGEIRSKWDEMPDGKTTVISTTMLERGCFADYTVEVMTFGANLGVQYSANPRENNERVNRNTA